MSRTIRRCRVRAWTDSGHLSQPRPSAGSSVRCGRAARRVASRTALSRRGGPGPRNRRPNGGPAVAARRGSLINARVTPLHHLTGSDPRTSGGTQPPGVFHHLRGRRCGVTGCPFPRRPYSAVLSLRGRLQFLFRHMRGICLVGAEPIDSFKHPQADLLSCIRVHRCSVSVIDPFDAM